jgi:uncharacterized protein
MLLEKQLTLTVLNDPFGVCRLPADAPIPAWAIQGDFFSITRTADELSIVCPENRLIDEDVSICEKSWRGIKIEGPLEFTLVGILASLLEPLSRADISIFAISTYDTDYILVKEKDFEAALKVLIQEGHRVQTH